MKRRKEKHNINTTSPVVYLLLFFFIFHTAITFLSRTFLCLLLAFPAFEPHAHILMVWLFTEIIHISQLDSHDATASSISDAPNNLTNIFFKKGIGLEKQLPVRRTFFLICASMVKTPDPLSLRETIKHPPTPIVWTPRGVVTMIKCRP